MTPRCASWKRLGVGALACWLGLGCAHQSVHVDDAELERAAPALVAEGRAEVRTGQGGAGPTTTIDSGEVVETVSGHLRVGSWVRVCCEPSGPCHFGGDGVTLQRVDVGRSARNAATGTLVGLLTAAVVGSATCGVGVICREDSARTVGAITLGGVGVALAAGLVALALCDRCWVAK